MIESNDLKNILFWPFRRFWSRSATEFEEGQYCFIFTKIGTKLKLKTNIGTKLSHFGTWQNYEVTRVKNKKKIQKNQKLTRDVDFNTI